MKESAYDLMCAFLLGLGNFCLFLGFDTQLTIAEPVLRSVHDRAPERIDAHAGYNGAAACTVVLMLFSMTAPWTLAMIGSKKSILLGSTLFTVHLCSFLYVHYVPYYVTAAGIGIGHVLFQSGVGAYTTEHSTARTIGRNSALSYSLATSGLMAGGLAILFMSRPPVGMMEQANATFTNTEGKSYRQYADGEIRLMYGAFATLGLVANCIFAAMPARAVEKSLAAVNDTTKRVRLGEQLKSVLSTMTESRMILAAPVFMFLGLTTSCWMSIYPATLIYSKRLSEHENLQAYFIMGLGVGEALMGVIVAVSAKFVHDFAKMTTQTIGTTLFFVAMALGLLSTPLEATHSPTDAPTLLIQPCMEVSILIAVLLGMADCALVSSRTVLCSLLIPEKISQVFCISKIHQPLASTVILFLSSFISMPMHFAINLVVGIIALFSYYRSMRIADSLQEMEKVQDNSAKTTSAHCA